MEAAHERGAMVVAGDVDGLAPALFIADASARTPEIGVPNYLADLIELVHRHGIRLLVPTIDTDLPVLAAGRASLEAAGCRVATSSEAFVAITMDKYATVEAFGSNGIPVPRSWLPPIQRPEELPEVVFVKPRNGSASKDVHAVGLADLDGTVAIVPDAVVQELLTGPEITIDALVDFDGLPIHYVPRIRIKTLGGESIQGVTLAHDDSIESWIERVISVCSDLGARGPLTIQAFMTDDGPVLTEVNPRFGGGFPLAHAAGGRYPEWLLDMVAGVPVAPRLRDYEAGLYMTRSNVERFVRAPLW